MTFLKDRRKQRRFERLCAKAFRRVGGRFEKIGRQIHHDAVYAVGAAYGQTVAPYITRYEYVQNGPSAPRLARIISARLQDARVHIAECCA